MTRRGTTLGIWCREKAGLNGSDHSTLALLPQLSRVVVARRKGGTVGPLASTESSVVDVAANIKQPCTYFRRRIPRFGGVDRKRQPRLHRTLHRSPRLSRSRHWLSALETASGGNNAWLYNCFESWSASSSILGSFEAKKISFSGKHGGAVQGR